MTVDPFRPLRKGNLLYGRGSCDMKGGLAAMMHALKEARGPTATVMLAAVVDEEHAYRGVAGLLDSGLRADGAIVGEPTELKTVIACKGALRWRIHSRGRAAHSSKPHLGINAIDKMAKLITAMQQTFPVRFRTRQHPLVGLPTLNIGMIQGGVQANVVADSCTIVVDRRLLPGETREQVWTEFADLFASLQADDRDARFEMAAPLLEDVPLETSPEERIVKVAAKVSGDVLGRSDVAGVAFGSDASKLGAAGIASIILGPGNIDRAHTADERVEVDQVILAAEIYARIIAEF
jgi:acetylornithine deacetylase